MANNTIYFENPHTGYLRRAPVGFSWTTLFFGCVPMIFRNAWKWVALLFIGEIVTGGLVNIIAAFIINKIYIEELINDGFKAKSVEKGTLEQVSMSLGIAMPALEMPLSSIKERGRN
jgi:hypothetical protein